MRKAILATLGIIALCSLCLAGTVSAYKTGYYVTQYQGTEITADGIVSEGEWTDSYHDWLYDGWTMTTSTWSVKWEMGGTPNIADQWLIEVLSDTTNDTDDIFTFCFDGQTDGGTAPQTDDLKIVLTGHGDLFAHGTVDVYRGTGSEWAPEGAVVLGTNLIIGASISASPASATPHWIIEMKFDKTGNIEGTGIPSCIRLQTYDESTGQILMWPPMSSTDVPDSYGYLDADISGGTIPEGLTIGLMLALSSVAVIISIRYFRKPKI
jgi:hypothetical protein